MDFGHLFDLLVGIAQASLGVFLAWKAFVATLKVPEESTHKKQKGVFALCCIAVIVLTGLQTYRNFGLSSRLEKIEENTQKPPNHTAVGYMSVEMASERLKIAPLLSLEVGQRPQIPIAFHNVGNYPLDSPSDGFVLDLVPKEDANLAFDKERQKMQFSPVSGSMTAHSETGGYHTAVGPNVTKEDATRFLNGEVYLCGFGAVKWRDESGWYETHFNECLQEEPNHRSANWHNMPEDEKEHRLTMPLS